MQRTPDGRLYVVVDANILINFIKVARLDILRQLHMYAFYIPDEVYREISHEAQRIVLDAALAEGWFETLVISDQKEMCAYAQYRRRMDDGEAACLAISVCRKWVLACDEQRKRVIRREMENKLGTGYVLNTPGLLLKAIREGMLTVVQADHIKDTLAQNRFVMNIASFQDLL